MKKETGPYKGLFLFLIINHSKINHNARYTLQLQRK